MNLSKCCWGSVDDKNTLMDQEAVENLSARQKFFRWIEEVVEYLSRRNPKTSMDRDCNKIYRDKKKEGLNRRESVENLLRSYQAWRKWVFQGGKTQRDECNKQATQT